MQSAALKIVEPEQDPRELLNHCASLDVNTLMECVFTDERGIPVRQGSVHEEMHEFIRDNDTGVIELHRECGKTTNMLGFAAEEIGLNPDIRVKIVSSSDDIAVSRGKALREVLESKAYHDIFPRIQPGREWTDSKISVKRNVITPESTVECYGVLSKATGGRCDLLLLDDIDDEEVVVSEAKRNRNGDRTQNVWLNLSTPTGRAYMFCTPWHERDTAHRLKASGWPTFRRPVTNMVPVWPERWGVDQLRQRKAMIGSLAFARGFELVPINSESCPIKGTYFRLWDNLPRFMSIGIVCDPNNSYKPTADYTSIGLLGVTYDMKVYLIEQIRKHYEFPELVSVLKQFAEAAQHRFKMVPYIGVEKTAYQAAIPMQLKIDSRFPIYGLNADKSKFIRASRLAVHLENGRVYIHGDGQGNVHKDQQVVYDECVAFPSSENVDCVDMLGYGVEFMLSLGGQGVAKVG